MADAHNRMLLVEGTDDSHFMYHFFVTAELDVAPLRGDRAPEQVLIRAVGAHDEDDPADQTGGIGRICATLHNYLDEPDVSVVGVIVDHDDPATIAGQGDRWAMLRGALASKGYHPPEQMDPSGLVWVHPSGASRPRVGVWIMPDNQTPGMVETFVQQLVRDGDGLMAHAQAVVAGLPTPRRFSDAHAAKAETHTYLAWQETPGLPMGQALKQRVYSLNTPAGQAFAAWLRRLFWPDPTG